MQIYLTLIAWRAQVIKTYIFGLITALLIASPVGALELYVGAKSVHFREPADPSFEYNENNKLAGIEYRSILTGYYKNSFGDDSFFVGKRFAYPVNDFEIRLNALVVYGYRGSCTKSDPYRTESKIVCPNGSLELAYSKYRIKPSAMIFGFFDAAIFTFAYELY